MFIFEKFLETIYTYIHVSNYLLIIYHVNTNVKEYLQPKHVRYIYIYIKVACEEA